MLSVWEVKRTRLWDSENNPEVVLIGKRRQR